MMVATPKADHVQLLIPLENLIKQSFTSFNLTLLNVDIHEPHGHTSAHFGIGSEKYHIARLYSGHLDPIHTVSRSI